jgi:hypothetical protein
LKGTTSISRKQRSTLSQSLSFPAKSAREDSIHKSIDGCLVKTKAKHVQASTLHNSSKSTNFEGKSNEGKTNTEGCKKRTTLISMPGLKRSVVVVILFPFSLLCCIFFASYIVVYVHNNISFLCASLEGLLQLLQSTKATHLRHLCKSKLM